MSSYSELYCGYWHKQPWSIFQISGAVTDQVKFTQSGKHKKKSPVAFAMKPHGCAFRRIIGYSELTYPGLSLKHILGKPLALCLECSMCPKTKAIRPHGNCSSSGRKHTDSLILHITAYCPRTVALEWQYHLMGLFHFSVCSSVWLQAMQAGREWSFFTGQSPVMLLTTRAFVQRKKILSS